MPDAYPDVQGRCPACRGESLMLADGGYVTCRRLDCPDPEAATRVLERRPDSCGSCGASPVTYYAPDGHPACADCAPCDCGTEPCSKPDVEPDSVLHAERRHPDWEYATTEGPRKQWDHADEPPYDGNSNPDPTWERNTDAGRDGWERFDYTEESYWRRRKETPAT